MFRSYLERQLGKIINMNVFYNMVEMHFEIHCINVLCENKNMGMSHLMNNLLFINFDGVSKLHMSRFIQKGRP